MKKIVLAVLLLATPVMAQQSPTTPPGDKDEQIQAFDKKLMEEIGENLRCNVSVIHLQKQLAQANAKVEGLMQKYMPEVWKGQQPMKEKVQ